MGFSIKKRFKKGIRLKAEKDRTLFSPRIQIPPVPRFVIFELHRKNQQVCMPVVGVGDEVSVGTKIAEAQDWGTAPIFSSVSGRISEINSLMIRIESDEADRMDESIQIREDIPGDPERLIEMIREAGIIDLGGTGRALHPRLFQSRRADVDTIIINGCESEPYLTSDQMLMMNHPVEILKGAELIRTIVGAKRVIIAVEMDKREAAEILNSKNYNLKYRHIKTAILPNRFLQGQERVLADTLLGRRPKWNENTIDNKVLVESVATVFAAYEAVYLRKPLYERVVTVSGPCVMVPNNFWLRSGTRASDIIRSCKGLLRNPSQLIFGGPMTGVAVTDFERPVWLETAGVLALPPNETEVKDESPCIRCGECVDVCPEGLLPESIVKNVRSEKIEHAQTLGMEACTECTACSYVCPSKIPIVSVIRDGKHKLRGDEFVMPAPIHTPEEQPAATLV